MLVHYLVVDRSRGGYAEPASINEGSTSPEDSCESVQVAFLPVLLLNEMSTLCPKTRHTAGNYVSKLYLQTKLTEKSITFQRVIAYRQGVLML